MTVRENITYQEIMAVRENITYWEIMLGKILPTGRQDVINKKDGSPNRTYVAGRQVSNL